MFKAEVWIFCFSFIMLTLYKAHALSAEQKAKIHEHLEKIGKECIQEYTITKEDISDLKARKIANGPNVPCFLACMMKKIGVIDEKGMLQKESALEYAKTIINDDEEVKRIEDYFHSCYHINEETVADGEKGCDRAFSAHKCMIENASQFGFEI